MNTLKYAIYAHCKPHELADTVAAVDQLVQSTNDKFEEQVLPGMLDARKKADDEAERRRALQPVEFEEPGALNFPGLPPEMDAK